jgi:hypothetical protein
MVRIFVGTTQVCVLYMIAYARKTNQGAYKDILVIDTPPIKNALVKVLTNTRKIYPWAEIINLSSNILPDTADFEPNIRKKFTRKIKNTALVKPFYNLLLNLYLKKQRLNETKIIRNKLSIFGEISEVNILTQTGINDALFKLYPKAIVNYFEHGQGDYFFIQNIKPLTYNFYCVFANKFRQYMKECQKEHSYIKNLSEIQEFPVIANEVIQTDDEYRKIKLQLDIKGKLVLILMDAVQIYHVPDIFWTDYLDLCINHITNPKEYTFILKPHHRQSLKSIEITKGYMYSRKLNTLVIENSHTSNYSVEVLYAFWENNTDYVFSIFSSGLFYISKLYGGKKTKYYYAYDFFKKYINNAPPQFLSYFLDLEELLDNVFSENCVDISGIN